MTLPSECHYCNKKIKFYQKKLSNRDHIWHDSCYKNNYPYALYVALRAIQS